MLWVKRKITGIRFTLLLEITKLKMLNKTLKQHKTTVSNFECQAGQVMPGKRGSKSGEPEDCPTLQPGRSFQNAV